jgi:hypothetical protein
MLWTRRTVLLAALSLGTLAGCRSGREFTLFGYSAKPPYRDDIRTVYVPVFKNESLQTTPNRELELEITRTLITEIEARTPMNVIADRERADTEILGTLRVITRMVSNINQQGLAREAEITANCSVVWTDLRTGDILSNPRTLKPTTPAIVPFDPTIPPVEPVATQTPIKPVTIIGTGRVIAELGQSNATANQEIAKNIAKQIVQMMEAPW